MKVLDQYIFKQVMQSVLAVLLVVLGLDLLIAFLDQMDNMNEYYTLGGAVHYVAWTLPRRLYEYIPLGTLVGVMIGLGVLASQSELTVMRAAGVSTGRILLTVFKPVLLMALLGLLLGQFIAPFTEQRAQSVRAVAMAGGGSYSASGIWHKEGNTFIFINAVESGEIIHGVTRYEFTSDLQLQRSSFARRGVFEDGAWTLNDVNETHLYEAHTQTATLAQERWSSGLTPDLLSIVVVEPVDLSITGLWEYASYLQGQGVSADVYLQAFWAKLLLPVSIAALVLAGISFVFGPLRSVPIGQRIVSGVILGLLFKFTQDLLGPASSVYGFPPLLATLLPILLCGLGGWYLLRRAG
ncbi:permease [Nitrincola sp. A-D6]|uniref:LPS export ABC transporter permease LptG n=1 Tax=Nitrincola sp. A-D6 TaxID=1545442 RepID=UPI00051F8CC6|nr:LPS export ABC transporter permease LptG [Nitrincola sp. A-D6]KGK43064.1 permease [Nitrincola sp. A-D6]